MCKLFYIIFWWQRYCHRVTHMLHRYYNNVSNDADTQFLTSDLSQGQNALDRIELPEDISIKLTPTIYNVPKTDTELAAIEIKGLLTGDNGYDETDGKSKHFILFWNQKEDKESLQIH